MATSIKTTSNAKNAPTLKSRATGVKFRSAKKRGATLASEQLIPAATKELFDEFRLRTPDPAITEVMQRIREARRIANDAE